MSGIRLCTCLVVLLMAFGVRSLHAQDVFPQFRSSVAGAVAASVEGGQVVKQPAGPPPTPRHTGIKALFKDLGDDVTHLPSRQNLFWVGIGGGLALAAHPFDDDVNRGLVGSDFADKFFKPGEVLG